MTPNPIDRGFVRLVEGLAHYRRVDARKESVPLVLLHASPGSSRGLEPLLTALAATGTAPQLIAPDTLGHGESAPAGPADPDIAYYSDGLVRMLDGLQLDRVALYGAHTGARIAVEAAILFPDRVSHVILDGIADYAQPLRDELIGQYAPEMVPDDYGGYLMWAFHFIRDQALHFPHYARDPAHRLYTRAVPDADALHEATLDVLKAIRTYHKAYRAAFAYPTRVRLAACQRPVTMLGVATELPSLRAQLATLAAAAPDARIIESGATSAEKAETLLACLRYGDRDPRATD